MILVGSGIGLLYGWQINPVTYRDISPETLRIDYRTDFALMVAEAYSGDADLDTAIRRLAVLGETSPQEITLQALIFAQEIGYSDNDLELLQNLLTAMQVYSLTQETPAP